MTSSAMAKNSDVLLLLLLLHLLLLLLLLRLLKKGDALKKLKWKRHIREKSSREK